MLVVFTKRRPVVLLLRIFITMTVVLRYGRAAAVNNCAGRTLSSRRGLIESPSLAFGYLLFRSRPDGRERAWSSLVASVALLSPPVKAFIEGSATPMGQPGKVTRTTVRKMRVADLRDELTQRKLETAGTRPILESRLIEALEEEGVMSTRTTKSLTQTTKSRRPSCRQELPLAGDIQIDPSRLYNLRVTAKVASFSVDESGAGMVLSDAETSQEVWAARQYFSTRRTSFESTYCAFVMALRHCREVGVRKVVLKISNDVMVDQLTGKMMVSKRPMKQLYWTVMDLLTSMDHFEVKYIPKEVNSKAENLAEKAVATKRSIGLSEHISDPLLPIVVDVDDTDEEVTIEANDEPNSPAGTEQAKPSKSKPADPTAGKQTASEVPPPTTDASNPKAEDSKTSAVLHESGIDPSKQYLLRVDGGSRNNPGSAGVGMVLYDESGSEIWCGWKFLGLGISNNVAEYTALLIGLQCVASLGIKNLQVESDSELVVKQLRGLYKVKSEDLKPIYRDVKNMMLQFDLFDLRHIPRKENARADELANHAMNEKSTYGFDDT